MRKACLFTVFVSLALPATTYAQTPAQIEVRKVAQAAKANCDAVAATLPAAKALANAWEHNVLVAWNACDAADVPNDDTVEAVKQYYVGIASLFAGSRDKARGDLLRVFADSTTASADADWLAGDYNSATSLYGSAKSEYNEVADAYTHSGENFDDAVLSFKEAAEWFYSIRDEFQNSESEE